MDEHPRLAEGAPTIEDLQAAFDAEPGNREAASRLGWELYGLRHYRAAIGALEAAHKLAPDDAEIAYVLGLSLKQLNEKDRAIKAFEGACKGSEHLENKLRASMLKRMSQGQINFLKSGKWNMEPPA
jgi:tetratricopeptide (TPR) repeat protein